MSTFLSLLTEAILPKGAFNDTVNLLCNSTSLFWVILGILQLPFASVIACFACLTVSFSEILVSTFA